MGDAMTSAMELDYTGRQPEVRRASAGLSVRAERPFPLWRAAHIQDADRGIEEIKKAVALAPDHVPALVSLSVILLKREDAESARWNTASAP